MEDSLKQAIETMERAMNGSAAVYRTPLRALINADRDNDRLVQETHNWSVAVKKLEAERDRFQPRVGVWMQETFGAEVSADHQERGFRFGEEALELLQANGTSKEDVLKLVDYVYSRPVGELPQEVGGTMVTLAALCEARGINLAALANDEQTRVEQPAVRAKIQQKQEAKRARMIATPLPGQVFDNQSDDTRDWWAETYYPILTKLGLRITPGLAGAPAGIPFEHLRLKLEAAGKWDYWCNWAGDGLTSGAAGFYPGDVELFLSGQPNTD